jgi:hypothetical protein
MYTEILNICISVNPSILWTYFVVSTWMELSPTQPDALLESGSQPLMAIHFQTPPYIDMSLVPFNTARSPGLTFLSQSTSFASFSIAPRLLTLV